VVASDNFNDGNDNGWTHYLTTSSNTPAMNQNLDGTNSAYRLTSDFGTSTATSGRAAGFLMSAPSLSDFIVSADLVDWDNTQSQQMGVMARVQSPILTSDTGPVYSISLKVTPWSM